MICETSHWKERKSLTTISELATRTIDRTSALDPAPRAHTTQRERPTRDPKPDNRDDLLRLDGPGWGRLLAQIDDNRRLVRQLDRLVAAWRTHSDYRRLQEMAEARQHEPVARATEALLSEWVTEDDCKRLGYLIAGMGFPDNELAICYSLCSSLRAVQSALDYAKSDGYLTEEEIQAASEELMESSEEYLELASIGMIEDSP